MKSPPILFSAALMATALLITSCKIKQQGHESVVKTVDPSGHEAPQQQNATQSNWVNTVIAIAYDD